MGSRSSIEGMADIKAHIDTLIRTGSATIDEILADIRYYFPGDHPPSRSAVGRYVKAANDQMERYKEAQAIAGQWVAKLDEQGTQGDVGRLNGQLLSSLAFRAISDLGQGEDAIDIKDVSLLARAIKNMADADKVHADREIKIRREYDDKVAKAVEAAKVAARQAGLSEEDAEGIEAAVRIYLPDNQRAGANA